jgi:hypothetical protein
MDFQDVQWGRLKLSAAYKCYEMPLFRNASFYRCLAMRVM